MLTQLHVFQSAAGYCSHTKLRHRTNFKLYPYKLQADLGCDSLIRSYCVWRLGGSKELREDNMEKADKAEWSWEEIRGLILKSPKIQIVLQEICNRRSQILKAANSYNTSWHVQWAVLSPIVIWAKCTQALLSSLSEDPISVRLSPFLWDARLSSELTVLSLNRSVDSQAFGLWISDRKQLPPQHPVSALTGLSQSGRVPWRP